MFGDTLHILAKLLTDCHGLGLYGNTDTFEIIKGMCHERILPLFLRGDNTQTFTERAHRTKNVSFLRHYFNALAYEYKCSTVGSPFRPILYSCFLIASAKL
jgi:hypothetical protein